jgi:hypothetical protein
MLSQALVAHPYNPSYSGDRDLQDFSSKSARANSSRDPIAKKPFTKKQLKEWLKLKPKKKKKKEKFCKVLRKSMIHSELIFILRCEVQDNYFSRDFFQMKVNSLQMDL